MIPYFDYARKSWNTPPDWRFIRAKSLVKLGCEDEPDETQSALYNPDDDQATLNIVRLLRYLNGHSVSICGYSHFKTAHHIFFDQKYAALRRELECRLLAGQNSDEAARIMSLPTGSTNAYVEGYFDISDRLSDELYIHTHVLRSVPLGSEDPNFERMVLHRLAYTGGLSVLEPALLLLKAAEADFTANLTERLQTLSAGDDYLESSPPVARVVRCIFKTLGVQLTGDNVDERLQAELAAARKAFGIRSVA